MPLGIVSEGDLVVVYFYIRNSGLTPKLYLARVLSKRLTSDTGRIIVINANGMMIAEDERDVYGLKTRMQRLQTIDRLLGDSGIIDADLAFKGEETKPMRPDVLLDEILCIELAYGDGLDGSAHPCETEIRRLLFIEVPRTIRKLCEPKVKP